MKNVIVMATVLLCTSCYAPQWSTVTDQQNATIPHQEVTKIFAEYPNNIMKLAAKNPGYAYDFDIGEKDK